MADVTPVAIVDAVADSKLAALIALRDRIARALDSPTTSARDLASNSKRIMEIMDEITVERERQDEAVRDAEKREGLRVVDESFDPASVA